MKVKLRQPWQIFFNLRGILWTMPSKIDDTLSLQEAGFGARNKDRWRIIPACIWWTIWRERNARCFEKSSNVQKIKLSLTVYCYSVFGV